jgi:glucose-6-phosphate 1-epimerase
LSTSIADLNSRFQIRGAAAVVEGNGGLPKIQITTPAASGEIYLHGAHVTSWKPAGEEEVLFLSPLSLYEEGKAIRGGVPVCFPWFGAKADDPKAPAHGFVRTKGWQLESIGQSGEEIIMSTVRDDSTRAAWPHDFRLEYRVVFGTELLMELTMTNTGKAPLRFEEALHAYYSVGDVTRASISGLDGAKYLDKTDSMHEKTQTGDVTITAETDRVYVHTAHALELYDPVLQRRIAVEKEESRTTVVWNPWVEKAREMTDLGEDQWRSMLCIEAANVGDAAVELAPGEQHTMTARARVGNINRDSIEYHASL